MNRKPIVFVALALLALPGIALASKPTHPVHPTTPATSTTTTTTPTATPNPGALFVLRGTLSAHTAAAGSTNGTISITVKGSNHEASLLKSAGTLTFVVTAKTNVVLHDGSPLASGDHGIVKLRAPKNSTAAALQTHSAFQVIDQGSST